jgi:hypothetical protein
MHVPRASVLFISSCTGEHTGRAFIEWFYVGVTDRRYAYAGRATTRPSWDSFHGLSTLKCSCAANTRARLSLHVPLAPALLAIPSSLALASRYVCLREWRCASTLCWAPHVRLALDGSCLCVNISSDYPLAAHENAQRHRQLSCHGRRSG